MKNALIIAVILEETLTTELVAEAADWQPYRVRAELKRLGVELTPVEAVKMICRRNDAAVSQLVESVRSMHANKERNEATIDALIARIEELEARNAMTEKAVKGPTISVAQLAEWAGVDEEELQILKRCPKA